MRNPTTPSLFPELSQPSYAPIHNTGRQGWSPTVVSLFTGAGGMDLGLEQAGFRTLACVEVDPHCRATLSHNRPCWRLINGANRNLPGDIRGIPGSELLSELGLSRGSVDLLAGGPPCQSFSNLGLKLGLRDPKNGILLFEFLRLIGEVMPRAVFFENVEGFAHRRNQVAKSYLVEKLTNLGYKVVTGVLNAADYGVPQVRKRFILLASLECEPSLPVPTHFDSLETYHSFAAQASHPVPEFRRHVTVAEALSWLESWDKHRPDNLQLHSSAYMRKRMSMIRPGENFHALPEELRPRCWLTGKHQGADTFGRLRPDQPSVTIRTSAYNPTKGRYIHPFENRGLTTLEMAILQSFPEEWRFWCDGRPTLSAIGRMIGNAVPVKLAYAVGLAIRTTCFASI